MTETPRRLIGRPFQPGNPGRPVGARNKLATDFLKALHADFAEHGIEAIKQCRETKPDVYVRVIAGLLPQQIEVEGQVDARQLPDDVLVASFRAELAAFLGAKAPGNPGEEGPRVAH